MKASGTRAIGLGLLIGMAGLPMASGYAGEHAAKCSLHTLKGQYLVAATGTLFPPAFGVKEPSISEAAGYSIYNGNGTGEDYVTFTINMVLMPM